MTEMLDFVKTLADPVRLQIVGLLARQQATREEIAARFNLSPKDALTHLGMLEFVGAVSQKDGVFTLNDGHLADMAKEKLSEQRRAFVPDDTLDERSKKVLRSHLNPDGSIRAIPAPPKLQVILDYLIQFFEFDRDYTEKEVNTIIRRFNEDTAGLRRDLIEANMMARISDGSRYWRVKA